METTQALLDSWNRQSRILSAVTSLLNEGNKQRKPSDDGVSLVTHLAHLHSTRRYFLTQVAPERANAIPASWDANTGTPVQDLDELRAMLAQSAQAVHDVLRNSLDNDTPLRGYDHPVMFLQHMVWHEGWHIGLLMLGLRLAGEEPAEDWEETHLWSEWRTEVM